VSTRTNQIGDLIFFAALTAPYDDKTYDKYINLLKYILSNSPDLLEKKSSQGYSPLHAAVKINKPRTVEFLIAQGANQRTRDKEGRNVLHSILAPGNWARTDVKDLKALLDLFDKHALKEMSLERCSVHPGALTPLGMWLSSRGNYTKDDVISLLANYFDPACLEMINGEGDLPLHVVSIQCGLFRSFSDKLLGCSQHIKYHRKQAHSTQHVLTLSREQYGKNSFRNG